MISPEEHEIPRIPYILILKRPRRRFKLENFNVYPMILKRRVKNS
ncbi:MAG: hypothetical protein NDF56_04440 [archaeon GB-1845-036]|nr:hypothetical protein [Candidatus Culexmicrobium thermophilum]